MSLISIKAPSLTTLLSSYFAITMGTGVVSSLLYTLPYNASWLYYTSVTIFALNVMLWCSFFIVLVSRYIIFPETWTANLEGPMQSVYLATVPTGLSTIINMLVYVCIPAWGDGAAYFVKLTLRVVRGHELTD